MSNSNNIESFIWRERLSSLILVPIWFLIFSAPFSLGEPTKFSSFIFDLTLLFLLIASIRYKFSKLQIVTFTLALSYFSISLLLFDRGPASVRDFLISYKSVLYLSAISLISGANIIKVRHLIYIYRAWTILFLAIYSIESFTLFSDLGRPDVFIENNFEIPALCIMHLAVFPNLGKERNMYQLTLIIISFLSGSFSGIVTVGIVTLISNASFNVKNLALFFVLMLLALVSILNVVDTRLANGLDSIDRVVFLLRFLYELGEWSWLNYMFGTFPMTALSDSTCNVLSFYENLFSRSDPGTCYSVVLHSFLLRVIFDHGIFGLILLFAGILVCLRGLSIRIRFAILSVLILNALSVSSFNSSIIALAVALSSSLRSSRPSNIKQT